MRELFDLHKDESEGRSGTDAYLSLSGRVIPFELKTTSKGSVFLQLFSRMAEDYQKPYPNTT